MSETNNTSSKSLHVQNEELENYFSNTIIPQLFVDADLILRKFTPPAMTHFNLAEEDIGKDIELVKENIKYPTIIQNIREVIRTGKILEKEVQTTDGKWYQMNILPYVERKENRTNGVIITFVDITQRIHYLGDLEKLNSEHETLMFALSHDIKQPLSALSMLGNVLKHTFEQQDRSQFDHYLQKLKVYSGGIEAIIDSFVAANDSHPQREGKLERINIENVVEDVVTGLRSEVFKPENYKCDFQTAEIYFSRNNLRSIVYNLVNNAIKYRHPSRDLEVRIITKEIDESVLLQVQDNGMGIAREEQERVFRKGERLNSNIDGTGMGLYIIRRMVEDKDARIILESTPGQGSVFSIYFKKHPIKSD